MIQVSIHVERAANSGHWLLFYLSMEKQNLYAVATPAEGNKNPEAELLLFAKAHAYLTSFLSEDLILRKKFAPINS